MRIVELSSKTMQVGVLDHGARLAYVRVPDRSGIVADISLGHDTDEGWLADRDFLGATIGRFANRIAGGRFSLDGAPYTVPLNEQTTALHGGPRAFDHADFDLSDVASADDGGTVVASLVSPDGENGFPGTLSVTVTITVADDDLTLDFRATTDAATVVNLTNHAYWNLSGRAATIDDHLITVAAETYLPVDENLIPTGELAPVQGSMDLRSGVRFGDVLRRPTAQMLRTHGLDHCYVLGESRSEPPRFAARVEDPGKRPGARAVHRPAGSAGLLRQFPRRLGAAARRRDRSTGRRVLPGTPGLSRRPEPTPVPLRRAPPRPGVPPHLRFPLHHHPLNP